ncbi:MAG TPA: hypothetical protein VF345_12830 [Chthoniobacterales bacterium]
MTAKNSIEECLEQPDHLLFTHRGCHVFVSELLKRFPDENYAAKSIEINDGYGPPKSGFHIVACRDGFFVDAFGIRREKDYCLWLCGKRSRADPKMPVPFVRWVEIESSDLLQTVNCNDPDEPLNKWDHVVQQDFVRIVEERARKFIEPIRERFQVSLLIEGSELRQVPLKVE